MILKKIYEKLTLLGDRMAFVGEDSCTYRELGELAAGAVMMLRQIPESTPVILYGGKCAAMLGWMLGCTFAGLPYVPVDSRTPTGRLEIIQAEVGAGRIIDTRQIEIKKAALSDTSIVENVGRTVYVIMTSGSSGKPKGVAVSEANLDAFCDRYRHWMGDASVSLGHASFAFDLSVADIYPTLAGGGCLYSIPADMVENSTLMRDFVLASECERLVMTPSFARLLLTEVSFRKDRLSSLNSVFFCGEVLPAKTVLRLWERFPGLRIVNAYGPTECTVATHAIEITADMTDRVLPAGIADDSVFIENGEIILGGRQVALGYLGNLQSKAFFERDGKRFYRTGDRGRICGSLLYIDGRLDRQLKLQGYRIEPGEIEQVLLSLAGVSAAAVFALHDRTGMPRSLCSAVVCSGEIETLTDELKKRLPMYMIPTLHKLDKLPMNANGKCDYAKLEATYGKQ
ncbi:MAG: AMP-binding protein [Clostridia bacterium]|nr:AMP-binding protein [Clostridia bacterium]